MRLPRGTWKWALAFVLNSLYFVVVLPIVLPRWASLLQWGLGALITVCLVGKLLFDTLFYDRYRT